MRLYGYFRSSAAYRCRIGFALKGITAEEAFVHLRKGDQKAASFRAVNPQGLVPALDVGGRVLTQSLAILEWLDETHPRPAFLPGSAEDRAEIRAFAQIIACDIHPLQNLRVLDYLRSEYGQDQAGVEKWCQRWIGDGLAACEAILAGREQEGPYCFGATPTLADICLVPQVFSAERFGVDLEAMPRVRKIHRICSELPAFAGAHPAKQPDSEA
ncbi:maleylacetoacetate isomerase [Ostreiculturibacter nitratireducens]|uniref:maleylacetoacetate isomerase n=1 Tax=Ostreiculturibacter nitratireducens TaxID=3075226 RepID=UPI0031B5EC66